jgi:CBS domain-containing protein
MRDRVGPDARVHTFMRANSPCITVDQPLEAAIAVMLQAEIEVLPIVSADGTQRVAGVLSPIDIFRDAMAMRKSA